MKWTVGDVATHMFIVLRTYADSASGRPITSGELIPDLDGYTPRMAVTTTATIRVEPPRDARALSVMLRQHLSAYLHEAETRSPDQTVPTPMYGEGASLPLQHATRLLLGEMLIHGYDVSRGINRPWRIDTKAALQVMPAAFVMMPRIFEPDTARNLDATFRVRLRGGESYGIRVSQGTVDTAPWGQWGKRSDCTLSAEPVAFLMLAYGRKSQWPLIASGRLLSYGRKPWLALSLRARFANP